MVFDFNTDFLIYYVLVGLMTYPLIFFLKKKLIYEEKPNWYVKCPSSNCSTNYNYSPFLLVLLHHREKEHRRIS